MNNIIQKGAQIEQQLIQKYENSLPNGLLEIWRNYGFATLLDGYLRVINPETYQNLLEETYFSGKSSIPIFATAFGDIITSEEDSYIGMVQYKNGNFAIIARNFEHFMMNLPDDYFEEKYFQIPQYVKAVEKLGTLEQDECFGYVPLLGLGGSEKIDNLRIVKTREHIELISQMVGNIGM